MVGYFCFALFGPSIEARFGWFGDMVLSQQVAELAGLIKATRIAINRRWGTLFLVGPNVASLFQAVGSKAGVGFSIQQKMLR